MCGRVSNMPGVKRSRDDSDNEEVEQDSDTEHTSEEDFALSDGSESEESSELDEQECDERRLIYCNDVGDLERQFALLREQLYKERLSQVEQRLSTVRSGEAGEYLAPLHQLKDAYGVRLEVAEVMRQFRMQNIDNKHQAEVLAAKQNWENEKLLVLCCVKEDLQHRVHSLQEDRHNIAVNSSLWAEENLRRSPRAHQKDSGDRRRRKAITVDGPYIVYRLRDEDILEDWTIIRRAMQATKQRKSKFGKLSSLRPLSHGLGL